MKKTNLSAEYKKLASAWAFAGWLSCILSVYYAWQGNIVLTAIHFILCMLVRELSIDSMKLSKLYAERGEE